jgi:hypothetical protein
MVKRETPTHSVVCTIALRKTRVSTGKEADLLARPMSSRVQGPAGRSCKDLRLRGAKHPRARSARLEIFEDLVEAKTSIYYHFCVRGASRRRVRRGASRSSAGALRARPPGRFALVRRGASRARPPGRFALVRRWLEWESVERCGHN